MQKIVLFNVGGALSAFAVLNSKSIVVDLGRSDEFSPVSDFLIPLARRGRFSKGLNQITRDKYVIDQLLLSHLDRDHISDYNLFRQYFHAEYMTCPNDNSTQDNEFKVNRNLLGQASELRGMVLADMSARSAALLNPYGMSAANPLVSTVPEISIHYILPTTCEARSELSTAYANNISIVVVVAVGPKTLLLPGDILKAGMAYLIENDHTFANLLLRDGVDYLVAPHHGLETAFSDRLFQSIKNGKTRLNVISEKVRNEDSQENRSDIDGRYYSANYASADNALRQCGVKTSKGHLVIDFEKEESDVRQYPEIESVLDEFDR